MDLLNATDWTRPRLSRYLKDARASGEIFRLPDGRYRPCSPGGASVGPVFYLARAAYDKFLAWLGREGFPGWDAVGGLLPRPFAPFEEFLKALPLLEMQLGRDPWQGPAGVTRPSKAPKTIVYDVANDRVEFDFGT